MSSRSGVADRWFLSHHPTLLRRAFFSTVTIVRWEFNLFGIVVFVLGFVFGGYLLVSNVLYAIDSSQSWDFANAGDFTLSDSDKIQVASGAATLKLYTSTVAHDTEAEFNAGTHASTQYDAGNTWVEVDGTQTEMQLPDSAATTGWMSMSGSVVLLHLNETAGATSFADTSGQNNSGSCSGDTCPTAGATGKMGNAAAFDGVGDFINVPSLTGIPTGSGARTISAWIKPTSGTARGMIVSYGDNANNQKWDFEINGWAAGLNGRLIVHIWDAGVATASAPITANVWHNVVVTYSGGSLQSGAKLYVDGVEQTTQDADNGTANSWTQTPNTVASNFQLGQRTPAGAGPFPGTIDEVGMWNRALTGTEVQAIYDHQAPAYVGDYTSPVIDSSATDGVEWRTVTWDAEYPSLKDLPDSDGTESGYPNGNAAMTSNTLLYHLDESAGATSFADTSGSSNTGSCTNCPTAGATGRFNKGLTFDGTNDVVSLQTQISLADTATYTIELWYKGYDTAQNSSWGKTLLGRDSGDIYANIILRDGYFEFLHYNAGWLHNIKSATMVADGHWHHLAYVNYANETGDLFVDGVREITGLSSSIENDSFPFRINYLMRGYNGLYTSGTIDEVAVYTRTLSTTEIADHYKRGGLRLRTQVRSCNDGACSGESFMGPDGTSATFYDEATNTGATPPTYTLTNVANNRYFQYRTTFATNSASLSPEVNSVTVTHRSYPVDSPSVTLTNSLDLTTIPASFDRFCEGTLNGSYVCTTTSTKPVGTEISYQLCNDTVANCTSGGTWKYWNGSQWTNASASQYSTASTINTNIGSLTPTTRYFSYRGFLTSSTGSDTPTLTDLSVAYTTDATPPTNPTTFTALNAAGGSTSLTSGSWYNYPSPSFAWSGAADAGSGVQGYFVYFGTDVTADPQTAGTFQTGTTFVPSNLTTGTTYYLRLRTRDVSQNISAAAWDAFTYKYDATAPVNPGYVAANPAGYSSSNAFSFIWPVGSDTLSGLSGYYYKTGAPSGTYASEQFTTTTVLNAIPAYQNGENVFYLRTADVAGNLNTAFVQVTYYYNADAPSAPQNLSVTPAASTRNSFAFSWAKPATYRGEISGYRYSVNAEPTATNTTITTTTSLAAAPFATQVGENTFYVVAEDDSGNINYDVFASVTFTASTAAPGVPTNVSITDASNRTAGLYALTVSWQAPAPLPDDFSSYIVERAIVGTSGASVRPLDAETYTEIAEVSDTAYTNTGLDTAKTYAYRIKTKDTTSNASAASSIVSKVPTGKFTVAPAVTKGPTVEGRSTSAVVTWTTDRAGTSFVQYGPSTSYGSSSGSLDAVTDHTVTLTGLQPSTTYHLRVQTIDVPELVDYSTTTEGFSTDVVFKTLEAPGITDIEISDVTLASAIVSWKTNVVASSRVRYGTTLGYGQDVTDESGSQTTNHTVRLRDLVHSTLYHIRIDSTDAEGNTLRSDDYVFETLKLPTASAIRFQPVKGRATATVEIAWQTNVPTTSVVSYRPEGAPASDALEASKAALETAHGLTITNLLDDTSYVVAIGGRDGFGNAVTGDAQRFKTDTDSRAPQITDIIIEAQTQGRGEEAKAQIIVTWNTDEPTTAQVEYGPGLSSADYPNRTAEEAVYSNTHVVVVSELDPAKTYHLRVRSRDRASNATESGDHVVITGKASSSILDLILTNLERTFGWLGGVGL